MMKLHTFVDGELITAHVLNNAIRPVAEIAERQAILEASSGGVLAAVAGAALAAADLRRPLSRRDLLRGRLVGRS